MKFKEAEQKMKEIAKGEYCAIRYDVSRQGNEIKQIRCEVYLNDFGWHSGETWESAISKLESEIAGTEHPEPEGAPE